MTTTGSDIVAGMDVPGENTVPARWARWATHMAALTPVPSGLWRIAMAVGLLVGFSDQVRHDLYGVPDWGLLYVIGLSVCAEILALLTLGLVRPWGEAAPGWIPLLGGRRVPPLAAVIPAAVGATVLTLVGISQVLVLLAGKATMEGLDGTAAAVMLAYYAPLLAWGPLLAAVTVSYYLRRRALPRRSVTTDEHFILARERLQTPTVSQGGHNERPTSE